MLRREAKRLAVGASRLVEPLETMYSHVGRIDPAPLLIIGAPRSGTTLLYQLLVQNYRLAYMTNIHHLVFGAPFLVERLVPAGWRRPPGGHHSAFGSVRGPWAPSEAGNFWYRFFPSKPHHVSAEAFPRADRVRLHNAISAMTRASGFPMVGKNVVCSVRIEAIARAVPEMRYVVVKRQIEDTAASILASRATVLGSMGDWWSVEPRGIERLRTLPPEMQAVEQVRAVIRSIEDARAQLPGSPFVDVNYERLSADPAGEIGRIGRVLELEKRPKAPPVPKTFARRDGWTIDVETAQRLRKYVEESQ